MATWCAMRGPALAAAHFDMRERRCQHTARGACRTRGGRPRCQFGVPAVGTPGGGCTGGPVQQARCAPLRQWAALGRPCGSEV
eukprot:533824-Alexandrium_andersonii.AAC.1